MSGSSLTPPGSPTSSRAGGSTAASLSSSTGSFAGRSVTPSSTPLPHTPSPGSALSLKDTAAKKLANRQITIPSADPSVDPKETNLHELLGKALNHMGAVLKLPEALATPLPSDPTVIADFIASAKETLTLAKQELNDAAQGFDAALKNDPDVKGMLSALEAFEATLNNPADPANPTTIDFSKAKEKATAFVTHFNALLTKAESMEDKGPGLASRIGRFIFAGVVCVASIIPFTLAILCLITGGTIWAGLTFDTTVKFVGVTIEMAKKKYEPQYADLRASLTRLESALAEDLVLPLPSSSTASASSPSTPAGAPRSASTPPFAAATTTTSSAASSAVSTSTTPSAALRRSASAPSFPMASPALSTGGTSTAPAAAGSHSSVSSLHSSTTAAPSESSVPAMSSRTAATASTYPKPPGGYDSLADAFGRLRKIGEEEDERHRNASTVPSQPGLAVRTPTPALPPRTFPSGPTAPSISTSPPTPEEQRRQSQAALEALLSALFTSSTSNPTT